MLAAARSHFPSKRDMFLLVTLEKTDLLEGPAVVFLSVQNYKVSLLL